ncbi:MAG: chemotaxis protein CheW [Chroococcales cyanobacterium]
MLLLLFYIKDERYALSVQQIVEVVPLVELKAIARSPDYVAGLLNYRGEIIPIIDLCQLMSGNPYSPYLSTRIIIVNYLSKDNIARHVGLVAERVTDTLKVSSTQLIRPEFELNTPEYLGDIITDEQGMIQCLHLQPLLVDLQQQQLLPVETE